jgi:hypothetical protein
VNSSESPISNYRACRSILVVAQNSRLAICYRRLPDGWEQVELQSIDLSLSLTQIYEDVPECE